MLGDRRCTYCDLPLDVRNKQGQWGMFTCSGCKSSLTRMLRSGKHGPTYAKSTKDRLRKARYINGKWVVPGEIEYVRS